MASEERRYAKDGTCSQTHRHHQRRSRKRGGKIEDEIRSACLDPWTEHRDIDDEKEVEEVDVKRTYTNVLQRSARQSTAAEDRSIVTEDEDYREHQGVHGKGSRKICPLSPQFMPAEMLANRHDGNRHDQRGEPRCVEKTLETLPITVYDVSGNEKMEEDDDLADTGPL